MANEVVPRPSVVSFGFPTFSQNRFTEQYSGLCPIAPGRGAGLQPVGVTVLWLGGWLPITRCLAQIAGAA
ncbi:Uncharacterised protein [Mycobacterium tuberculosis]|nr:Uncharacterised protein [Mycobacterium tuberculosis]